MEDEEKQQVAMRELVLSGRWVKMRMTEGNPDSPQTTAALWPAFSVQAFVKKCLPKNSVTTDFAFIMSALLVMQDPWSTFEPIHAWGVGSWAGTPDQPSLRPSREGFWVSFRNSSCCLRALLARSPCPLLNAVLPSAVVLVLLPMLTHVLPLTPLAFSGWPKQRWINVVDEEYCSEEELGLSMALSTAWWAWGKLLSFSASVSSSVRWEWSLSRGSGWWADGIEW